ncbi:MAG: hypothetical protein Q8878_09660, partial [Bacillota bacterium]|nr:hypothetical protein [Bacillota bacterium]
MLLAAFSLSVFLMAGYYLGYRSASGGIVIEADREPSENVTAAADTDDLDRYFEPEGEETKE